MCLIGQYWPPAGQVPIEDVAWTQVINKRVARLIKIYYGVMQV